MVVVFKSGRGPRDGGFRFVCYWVEHSLQVRSDSSLDLPEMKTHAQDAARRLCGPQHQQGTASLAPPRG